MKYSLLILPIILSLLVCAARGDELPRRLDFTRYAAMLNHSPFAVATAPVQAPSTPSWSKDLYLANAARTTEADFITVLSGSDKNLHEYVSTIEPNSHGYSIANIQWSDQPGETKATISKDGQYATIGFNQALLTTTAPLPPMPGIVQPGGVAQPNNAFLPKPFPTSVSTPAPHIRGMIERNPRVPQPPPGAAPFTPPKG